MIDIHSHILFGIDDGSKSIEESINILNKAIRNGYTDIILTPHYRFEQNFVCNNLNKYKRFVELQNEVNKLELPINLYLGNEITIDEDLFYYLNAEEAMPLNGTRYLLIELPFFNAFEDLDKAIDRLLSKGNIPIIAHPERYEYYEDLSEFERLLKKGVLFQGNINTLYGKYGSKAKATLEEMLKKNMIHFMASDIHNDSQTSYDRVTDAKRRVEELTRSKKIAEDLFINNARRVINNEKIEAYRLLKKKYKFKLFGSR
ncbi:MAG: hypothetical protein IJ463_03480 [Bacilli bacterium]|nr:hypothetical protein [Bacilli bacterium]